MPASITVHTSDTPLVSVLILSQRDPGMLHGALATLAQHLPLSIPVEVLVLCNGAGPDVVAFARHQLAGVRVVISPVNLGFGGGNNRLARLARGEYLLLLNDDARVEPGWLEPLVATARAHPEAGAVASRILFPDGRVQEAGSVLFADASTAPVGRGLPAGSATYGWLRRVDYASANSLLVRAAAFHAVGGFDEGYFPAYYEDVDLALALRAAGYVVLYDGRSRISHHESASTTTHYKHFLFRRNIERVREKRAEQLRRQLPRPPGGGPDGPEPATLVPAIEHARGNPPRLLVVDDMLPVPSYGAGFVLMHDMAVQAGLDRWACSIAVTKHPGADPMSVAALGYAVVDGDLVAHLADPATRYDAVLICRPDNFSAYGDAVRQHQPQAALVYVAEALFADRLEREATLLPAGDPATAKLRKQAAETRVLEQRIAAAADRVVAVSEPDATVLRAAPGSAPVDVVPPRQPAISPTPECLAARREIAFAASWTARGNTPNYDAFWWLTREVLPLLLPQVPWTRLRVTGANAPEDVLAVAGPHIELTGFLPSLGALYEGIRVAVTPDRFGAGVKIKTLEALQYGVPVVTTTIGAAGIEVPAGTTPMVVADDPADFAAAVGALLTDNAQWRARRADIEALHERWRNQPRCGWVDVVEAALAGRPTDRSPGHSPKQPTENSTEGDDDVAVRS